MRVVLASLGVVTLILGVVAPAVAQAPASPPPGGMSGMMGGPGKEPCSGEMGHGMRGMTGGMMPMMMQMMLSGHANPKVMGEMLEMRGEIMKAVGDVLIKHGKALQVAK